VVGLELWLGLVQCCRFRTFAFYTSPYSSAAAAARDIFIPFDVDLMPYKYSHIMYAKAGTGAFRSRHADKTLYSLFMSSYGSQYKSGWHLYMQRLFVCMYESVCLYVCPLIIQEREGLLPPNFQGSSMASRGWFWA